MPWAHLDIAGTTWSKKDAPTVPKGATAFGLRLLDRFVAEYYEEQMTEVGFYHLTLHAAWSAPCRGCSNARSPTGTAIVVMAGSDERVAALDALLWTYGEASFLPHGTARDGQAARQPVSSPRPTRTPTRRPCWC